MVRHIYGNSQEQQKEFPRSLKIPQNNVRVKSYMLMVNSKSYIYVDVSNDIEGNSSIEKIVD